MIYRFIDDHGTFEIRDPQKHSLYFPLTDSCGRLLSAIGPNLAGDIKRDNEHFLTLPASVEDLRSGMLCRREFFLRANGRLLRLSEPCKDRVEAGFLYQKLIKRCPGGVEAEVLNFIPHDIPVEVMRVRVTNRSRESLELLPLSFIPLFGRSEKNLRDHRHVSSLLNRVRLLPHGIVLRPTMVFDERAHRANTTGYFCFGYEGNGAGFRGQFPTLDSFFGEGGLLRPDAAEKDLPGVTEHSTEFDGKEACAAFRFARATLAPGASREYVLLLGIAESDEEIRALYRKLDRPAKVEAALRSTKEYWRSYLSGLSFDFHDRDLNGWLSWVTLQPVLRKLFGCSFLPHFDYGKGGRGWRDLWQDALALLLTEPDKARGIIAQSFRGVRIDGSNATIITREGDFIADRNKISRVWMDHGVWPYLTTRLYINRCGDPGFLLTGQTYFRDNQIRRAKGWDASFSQKDFLLRDAKGRVCRGSILEHILVQNLVQFFNVGSHNVTRLENADWNDGMDMAAQKGESVVFSFMYSHNLRDLIRLLGELKRARDSVSLMKELCLLLDRACGSPVDYADFRAKQERLEKYFDRTLTVSGEKTEVPLDRLIDDLRQKWEFSSAWLSKKEWLPQGFFNGYYDNKGKRVEGKTARGIRVMLPGQVFAIMSGIASEGQVKTVWASLNKYLRDPRLKGFRLNTDFGSIQMDLGRLFGFSYGDKENGAFFSHMQVMLANALYSRGFVREGRDTLDSIRHMAMADEAGIPPVLPEYFNSRGKGLYLYLTGSASWYVYTLTQEMLGIKFSLGDLLLEPKLLPSDIKQGAIDVRVALDGATSLHLHYSAPNAKGNLPLKARKVLVGGRQVPVEDGRFLIDRKLLAPGVNRIAVTLL